MLLRTILTTPSFVSHLRPAIGLGLSLSAMALAACDANTSEVGPDGSSVEPAVDASTSPDAAPEGTARIVDIDLGGAHGCALISDGRVACWGDNEKGQLGDGSITTRTAPVFVEGLDDATAVFAGGSYSCAIHEDKTVSCWGDNWRGNLGIGSTETRLTPTPVPGVTGVKTMALSQTIARKHTCAVTDEGSMWCWGTNDYGAVGTGEATEQDVLSPTQAVVAGSGITSVANGYDWTCVSSNDGSGRCWGRDYWNVLGRGTTNNVLPGNSELILEPTQAIVSLSNAVEISNGGGHSCAFQEGGNARCWGSQSSGALGAGPAEVGGNQAIDIENIHQIEAGSSHTCAVAGADREVLCFGFNSYGQCGSPSQEFEGDFSFIYTPTKVPGIKDVDAFSTGRHFACALSGGELSCWGSNYFGQLGANFTEAFSETPLVVDLSNLDL